MKSSVHDGIQASHATLEAPPHAGVTPQVETNAPKPVDRGPDATKLSYKGSTRARAFVGVAVIVVLLLGRAVLQRSKPASRPLAPNAKAAGNNNTPQPNTSEMPSRTPIIDPMRAPEKSVDQNPVNAEQIEHTAAIKPTQDTSGSLGAAPKDGWTPDPYSQTAPTPAVNAPSDTLASDTRSEHDAMDKASLVFVKSAAAAANAQTPAAAIDFGIGLPPGTRFLARLESAVNTAAATPVVAVIEYNYERNGELVVPAGAKVFGRLEAVDRSGYVGVRFDSLMMPDGSSLPVEAAATDLQLRPLRGRVEGKNTGKNIVVRSLAGVGEIGAALVGRGSLSRPLSENDLLRERVAANIGQASDQQLQNTALTEHIVVSVPAGREIYVVLEKPAKESPQTRNLTSGQMAGQPSMEELRQLLLLQREMNPAVTPTPHE